MLLLTVACGAQQPLLETMEQGSWQPRPHKLAALTGSRDGAEISFSLVVQGDSRILVEGLVHIDPRPRLVNGRWREEGPAIPRSGDVSALVLDFLGGQGGRPSLGGRFLLAAEGETLYRINLPATPLESPP